MRSVTDRCERERRAPGESIRFRVTSGKACERSHVSLTREPFPLRHFDTLVASARLLRFLATLGMTRELGAPPVIWTEGRNLKRQLNRVMVSAKASPLDSSLRSESHLLRTCAATVISTAGRNLEKPSYSLRPIERRWWVGLRPLSRVRRAPALPYLPPFHGRRLRFAALCASCPSRSDGQWPLGYVPRANPTYI